MKLQTRTALVPLITVSLLTIGLYALVSQLTINSFDRLESEILQKQVERVNNSVSNLVDEHALKIVDWAQWDKTYDFMQSLDKAYIEETLNPLTMGALGFSSAMYFTPKLTLRYGVTVVGETVEKADSALVEQVRTILAQATSPSFQGLVHLGNDIFMLAASPILPNKGDQKSRGVLVAMSKITPDTFALVQHATNLSLTFWQKDAKNVERDAHAAALRLENGESAVIKPLSTEQVHAYGAIRDGHGKPLLFFQVEDGRQIVAAGVKVRDLAMTVLAGAGVLAILLLVLVINLSAVTRIEEFSAQVRKITTSADSVGRLIDDAPSTRSLRFKTAGGVFAVFVVTTVLTSVLLNRYLLQGFDEIEDKVMNDNIERATRALTGRLDKLQGKTIDWAQWDDTYQFIQDHNEAYSTANLGFDTLGTMNLTYVMYFDSSGRLVDGREVQHSSTSVAPVEGKIADSIAKVPALAKAAEPKAGFLSLPVGTILAAASPILDTSRTKPSLGSMIFAFLADDALAQELGKQTRLMLRFTEPQPGNAAAPTSIMRISTNEIEGKATIFDFLARPALGIAVSAERPIYEQGLLAAKVLPGYFILGGILCALVTVIWVDRVLLSRMRRIGQEAGFIQNSGDAAMRVTSNGKDEISGLARDINLMLVALENTQLELGKARDAAESANRAKSMFIARVSHELRTPVGGIVGLNRIIKKQEGLPRAVRELVEMTDVTAHSLLSIVDEILDFAKAESGELTFEKIPFDIRQTVRETMQSIAGRLEGKYRPEETDRVQLICDVDANVPNAVLGDPTRLRQILTNLLGNSVKFTQAGHVALRIETVELAAGAPTLRFQISDTGIGIPDEKLETIFEPFKQSDASTTRKYQGTGLGLSIVKQFTNGLGGSISVSSTHGQGSVFTVIIPFGAVAAAAVPAQRSGRPASSVLIASPSAAADAIAKNLSQLGTAPAEQINPFTESNLQQLSRTFQNADLLVISEESFTFPGISGPLKERLSAKRGCTVAMLRPSSIELREKLYGQGLNYILPTPVLADDLVAAYLGTLQLPGQAPSGQPAGLSFDKRLRVLIVDDLPTNRIILEEMLEDAGHSVTSVGDGTDMVEKLTRMIEGDADAEHFDIVLTDISMAIMDGDEATRAVRQVEKKSMTGIHVPIIAVTAHALEDALQKIYECGVDGIVIKPIDPEKVAAEFKRLLAFSAVPFELPPPDSGTKLPTPLA